MSAVNTSLEKVRIAVPESRQLDAMAGLLARRGADVLRIPLVAIHDAPDPGPVLGWMKGFIDNPPELFIIYTGEGIRRLMALADKNNLKDGFVDAVRQSPKLCRGPKPDRALREAGLKGDIPASAPTTAGVIETLKGMDIDGKRVAVQLYGQEANQPLMDYLAARHAVVDTVAPYVYADDSEEARVMAFIHALGNGEVDAVAFTSQPQVRRLLQVAEKHQLMGKLKTGLERCRVAAVGPVVQQQLKDNGVRVDIMPGQAFFMKPLVTEIMKYFISRNAGQ